MGFPVRVVQVQPAGLLTRFLTFPRRAADQTMLTILLVTLLVPLQSIDTRVANELDKGATLERIYSELKTLKEICRGEEKCDGDQRGTLSDFSSQHCGCSPLCGVYGDCCRDTLFYRMERTANTNYSCVPTPSRPPEESYYMISKCPKNTSPKIRRLCENPKPTSDPVANNLPVTIDTPKLMKQTYLNAHCARCNGVSLASAKVWKPHVECYDAGTTHPEIFKVTWNVTTEKWTVLDKGKPAYYDCEMRFKPPESGLRQCWSGGFVDTCRPKWRGTHEEEMCHSYTAIVTVFPTNYRNIYCAMCNDANTTLADCGDISSRTVGRSAVFSNLLKVDESEQCKSSQFFDEVTGKCRSFECEGISGTKQGVGICASSSEEVPSSSVLGIVTVVGLSISIFFLVLHLCAVALVQDLRNHSGMNLSSLCVALLGAYISFIAGALLKESPGQACRVFASLTYYFFMSAFFWMLIIAFDVWRVLRGAVRHFKSLSGRQIARFFVYSLFAWGASAVLTTSVLLVDSAAPGTIVDNLRPKFGEKSCWFSQRLSMVTFFATPLAVIMALNVMFFVSSACMASSSRLSSPSSSVSGHHRDFRLYLRLAILLGLTWVVGLLAMAMEEIDPLVVAQPLWICFMLLNTLQGLFIFAMFTCTSKVLKGLSKPLPWVSRIRDSLKRTTAKPTDIAPGSDVRFTQSTSDTTLKSSSNTASVEICSQARSPSPHRSNTHLQVDGLSRRLS